MKIKVLKKDIDKANRIRKAILKRDGSDDKFYADKSCPIAQAIRRTTRKRVRVSTEDVKIADRTYALPEVASCFIGTWDDVYEAKPIQFELNNTLLIQE